MLNSHAITWPVALTMLSCTPSGFGQQTIAWTGFGAVPRFSFPGNWDAEIVPGDLDTAQLVSDFAAPVYWDQDTRNAGLQVVAGEWSFESLAPALPLTQTVSGTAEIGANATLTVTGPMTLEVRGELAVNGSLHAGSGGALVAVELNIDSEADVAIEGSGVLHAAQVNGPLRVTGGVLDPIGGAGEAVGTMTITGNPILNTSRFHIDVAGTNDHDAIHVVGTPDLSGMGGPFVEVSFIGFRPDPGDHFEILSATGPLAGGGFIVFPPTPGENGVQWSVAQTPHTVTLVAEVVYNPGDFNLDGQVDLIDLDILGQNWLQEDRIFAQGDSSGDGLVNLLDLDALGQNWLFGTTSAMPGFAAALAASGFAVPEPTTAALIAGLGLWISGRRRR